jgi:hypothetical protein
MNPPRDPDLILAAWLDENAIPLPTTTRRAIDVAIRTTPQDRRSTWLPRRSDMNILLRLGAVAAVLVVAVGTFALIQRPPDAGVAPAATPGASPGASSSAAPDPSTWETFTSERYGFEVRYPIGWDVYPSTGQYQPGVDNDDQVVSDRITVGAGFSGLYSSSAAREADTTPELWIEQHVCPCEPAESEWESRTVDGQPALQRLANVGEEAIEMYVFTDERVYRFIGVSVMVRDQPLWEAFVSTIRLHPEDAVDTP